MGFNAVYFRICKHMMRSKTSPQQPEDAGDLDESDKQDDMICKHIMRSKTSPQQPEDTGDLDESDKQDDM
ncbi:unnamed protein product [Ilex paraguariensis]|uniref:Uncharacterized protein n=1 Tax=Ilex paraguariensis TaxID=185542 RepID=A0ABC8V378_9AQUA